MYNFSTAWYYRELLGGKFAVQLIFKKVAGNKPQVPLMCRICLNFVPYASEESD